MNPTLKKILLIITLIIVTVLIALALYFVFKKTTATPTPSDKSTEEGGTLPTAGDRNFETTAEDVAVPVFEGSNPVSIPPIPQISPTNNLQTPTVKKVLDENISHTSLSSGNGARFYNNNNGKFYKLESDGQLRELSEQVFYNVSDVTWAKNNDKAVLTYPDNTKTIYDFEKEKQVTLPKHWQEFSFSPDSSQVAAKSMGLSPDNRWLVTINDDGSGTTLIEPMGENAKKVQINWSPSRQTVAFSQTGQAMGADRREVLFVGLNGENFKSAIVEGQGFQPQWSPDGQKLLYSVYSSRTDFKPEIWITDSYGDNIDQNRQMLKLNTWANKCSFGDENTLFCAVPRDLPQGAGMSPEIAASSNDDMYKIDLKTGYKTIVPLDSDYNIKNISYDKTKNKLFFTDTFQNGVFEIKL